MTTAHRSTWRDFPGTVLRLGARLFLLLALAGAGVGAAAVHAATPSPDCAERLKPLVTAKMSALGVPGLIVSIDAPTICRWTEALGVRDVTKHRPMQGNEHMRVGSITKTFTGTVVLQLVDEGLLGLDDPISRYLTGVPNGDTITIRQLLTMTSGLYNYSDDLAFNASLDTDPQRVWTPEELLAIGLAQPPYFPPGTAFHYSNTNSVLLGRLIEALTGHPLDQEFERRLFTPLKLHDTSLPRHRGDPPSAPARLHVRDQRRYRAAGV